jgi:hypothetical protein
LIEEKKARLSIFIVMRKLRRSLQVSRQIEESREALLTDQKIFEELQGQIKAGEKKMEAAEKTLLGN